MWLLQLQLLQLDSWLQAVVLHVVATMVATVGLGCLAVVTTAVVITTWPLVVLWLLQLQLMQLL